MIVYLLQVLFKWIQVMLVSLISLFNVNFYYETNVSFNSISDEKDTTIINDVIPYTTIINYNPKLPSNISNVITEGVVGLSYTDSDNTQTIVQNMKPEVIEQGSGAYGLYTGTLTGYGPDCVGCSKVGNVACFTKDKKNHSLISDGIYYTDDEYGKVRIVAAAKVFPCGTIVQITKQGQTPFYAVVLDRGGSMNYAWSEGRVWMDLAYEANALAGSDNLTGRNIIEFSVQRWGW